MFDFRLPLDRKLLESLFRGRPDDSAEEAPAAPVPPAKESVSKRDGARILPFRRPGQAS
ncbi:MAG: hypothetical protein WBX15_14300 [Thermoanaerobaculia bacterium]